MIADGDYVIGDEDEMLAAPHLDDVAMMHPEALAMEVA